MEDIPPRNERHEFAAIYCREGSEYHDYVDEFQEEYEVESDFFITPPTEEPVDNSKPRDFQYKRFNFVDGRG